MPEAVLYLGDCVAVMAAMPDACVDAVVCDPPYGLEFMGKEWDRLAVYSGGNPKQKLGSDAPVEASEHNGGVAYGARAKNPRCTRCGKFRFTAKGLRCVCVDGGAWDYRRDESGFQMQAWHERWAREALRVLKPGGHLLAFGGTRTYHRLACAIEDAGFEIRDSLHWIYGCVTADVELLTADGWKLGIDVQRGEHVAQWDSKTGAISLAPVSDVFRAPWDGPMRVLRHSDTDQLLTPNHRVYCRRSTHRSDSIRRPGPVEVVDAGDIGTGVPIWLPTGGEHDGAGIGGEDYAALLGWVWTEGGFDRTGTGVRVYQSSVNASKVAEIDALLSRLGANARRYNQLRTYTRRNGKPHPHVATTWYFSGESAARVRADLPGKHPTYALLWRMSLAEKRAMLRAAMLGDGTGWGTKSEQFYQKHETDLVWMQTLLALVGRSGKVGMRTNRPGGAVYLRKSAWTQLQQPHLKRHREEHYRGEVWCVSVPTGAFVARRNGKVFVTGNSGFPKSLDVGKAIDKAAGAEREVVGPDPYASNHPNPRGAVVGQNCGTDMNPARPVTAPSTDAARRWAGWGTALKPAHEPIVVARKPLDGTVAACVQRHGTGASNVDACRVATTDDTATRCLRRDADGNCMGHGDAGQAQSGETPHAPLRGRGRDGEPSADRSYAEAGGTDFAATPGPRGGDARGRWPANVVFAHSVDCVRAGTRRVAGSHSVGEAPKAYTHDRVVPVTSGARRPHDFVGLDGLEAVEAWTCAPDCPVAELDRQSGERQGGGALAGTEPSRTGDLGIYGAYGARSPRPAMADTGGASRFFPQFAWDESDAEANWFPFRDVAKAPRRERERGLAEAGIAPRLAPDVTDREPDSAGNRTPRAGAGRGAGAERAKCSACGVNLGGGRAVTPCAASEDGGHSPVAVSRGPGIRNHHPTVKPVALMRWLVRLVTPPRTPSGDRGIVLDPFLGSGTTGVAATLEGFDFVGIEREPEYHAIAKARAEHHGAIVTVVASPGAEGGAP